MKLHSLAAALMLGASISASPVMAGDQYVDGTGFAVSGYDVVAYFSLPQSEVGTPQVEGIPGNADITAEYNGSTFAFSTEENRDKFVADPAKYAPQYDGHCAYGVSQGGKVPANPNLWRVVDDKLYLNITDVVVGFWEEDIPGLIDTAEGKWSDLEPEVASERPIPKWTSEAPLKN